VQADLPLTAAVRTGEAALLRRRRRAARARAGLSAVSRPRSFAVLRSIASGRVLGALSVTVHASDDVRRGRARAAARARLPERGRARSRAALRARAQRRADAAGVAAPARAAGDRGLDLAARLEAGAPGVDVGGDFYDAFELAEGVWGLAIGDVCGKGVDAAALTALARHTLRAAALERESPSAVLELLNRAVLAEGRPGQFLTAIFARLQALPGGASAPSSRAAATPAGGARRRAGATALRCVGTLLGVVEDPSWKTRRSGSSPATQCCSTPTG
jgi:sigma-B regulation protein RsbU (phosphoserine phosphatase)